MARKSNPAYWSQRMKLMEDALKDRSFSYVENMERQFMAAQAEVERQIAVWYQRFAANNQISLADAKRLLTAGELAEFRWTVGEYIAYGQQNAIDGAWMRQLENASARVHISRLEAIKLQIQQQAEVLYSNQLDLVDVAAREMYLGSYYGTAFELQRGLGVGWTMQAVNDATIAKVLSRPWTVDDLTFRDRCWTNKQALVNSVNTQLTQMIIRGEAPDKAIVAISHQFKVSRGKAGRLVMTETAAFSSAAQKDSFTELGVERFKVVATFDKDTCDICGAMDGQAFKMSEYQVGLTAPPFHPWCRCCTCPYYDDMAGLGERWTRNPDGTTAKVPADMGFDEWKEKFVGDSSLKSDRPAAILTEKNLSKVEGNTEPVKATVTDVTAEYIQGATPEQGLVTYDVGYKPGTHKNEIATAEWLHRTFGGDIHVFDERGYDSVSPDFRWRGKLWELKNTSTANATDNAVKKAIKQIQDAPGGIILDYGENEISDTILGVIKRRIERSRLTSVDVMLLQDGKLVSVLRHKK